MVFCHLIVTQSTDIIRYEWNVIALYELFLMIQPNHFPLIYRFNQTNNSIVLILSTIWSGPELWHFDKQMELEAIQGGKEILIFRDCFIFKPIWKQRIFHMPIIRIPIAKHFCFMHFEYTILQHFTQSTVSNPIWFWCIWIFGFNQTIRYR